MSERLVLRGGVRLAYRLRGSGPPVVLVQGLALSGQMWLGLPGGLVQSGYAVILPDARGSGRSAAPLPPYRMQDLADDLAAVINDAGLGPALVVGISLGGMIAQQLALRHPQLVQGLVLAATSCGRAPGRLSRARFLALTALSFAGSQIARRRLRGLLADSRSLQAQPELFSRWDQLMADEPRDWRGLLGQLLAASAHRTCSQLSRISCPTEVIAACGDRVFPWPAVARLAERIPGATLVLLPHTGHAFPLEQPRALPAAIGRVWRRIEAKRVGQGR